MKKCPKCKNKDLTFYTGGLMGLYECKNCGYIGPFVIEEDDK